MNIVSYFVFLTVLAVAVRGDCPADTARRAQQCFTDLATGVAAVDDNNHDGMSSDSGASDPRNLNTNINNSTSNNNSVNENKNNSKKGPKAGNSREGRDLASKSQGSGSGSMPMSGAGGGAMPLDYRKIGEYCAEDGYMPRFVRCVEELSEQCPDLPPEGALQQLINPERVRTSVPNLCNNSQKVEEGSECMNREMNRRSSCKERAYDMIKSGMIKSAHNNTAMFFLQCRFFSVLAECQRVAVSEKCGGDLGDLHADFLLSFVPNICIGHQSDNEVRNSQGHDPSGDARKNQGRDPSEDARKGRGHDSSGDAHKGQDHKPSEDTRKGRGHDSSGDAHKGQGHDASEKRHKGRGRHLDPVELDLDKKDSSVVKNNNEENHSEKDMEKQTDVSPDAENQKGQDQGQTRQGHADELDTGNVRSVLDEVIADPEDAKEVRRKEERTENIADKDGRVSNASDSDTHQQVLRTLPPEVVEKKPEAAHTTQTPSAEPDTQPSTTSPKRPAHTNDNITPKKDHVPERAITKPKRLHSFKGIEFGPNGSYSAAAAAAKKTALKSNRPYSPSQETEDSADKPFSPEQVKANGNSHYTPEQTKDKTSKPSSFENNKSNSNSPYSFEETKLTSHSQYAAEQVKSSEATSSAESLQGKQAVEGQKEDGSSPAGSKAPSHLTDSDNIVILSNATGWHQREVLLLALCLVLSLFTA